MPLPHDGSQTRRGRAETISLGGDLTGDGGTDLVVGTQNSGYGYSWVVAGTSMVGAAGIVTFYDAAQITGDYSFGWGGGGIYAGLVSGPQSDVDGDGIADLLTTGTYNSYGYGLNALHTSTVTSGDWYDDSLAVFAGDSDSDYTRSGVTGDIDGDGFAEVVSGNVWDNYGNNDPDSGAVAIYSGADIQGGYYTLGDEDDYIQGDDDYDYFGWAMAVQDMDGDGYGDLLIGAPGADNGGTDRGAVYLIGGNSNLEWNNDKVSDAATWEISGAADDTYLGYYPISVQGDLDGDGTVDLALSSGSAGAAWVWWDITSVVDGDVTSAAHTFTSGGADFGASLAVADFDGDGVQDMLVGEPGNDQNGADAGAVWLYRSGSWGAAVTTASGAIWGGAAGRRARHLARRVGRSRRRRHARAPRRRPQPGRRGQQRRRGLPDRALIGRGLKGGAGLPSPPPIRPTMPPRRPPARGRRRQYAPPPPTCLG